MDELISVIVPVYNVEAYLRRCLDSIIAQAYKQLEIILIDDGSTDTSSAICDEYAALDSRIKVIHQKNTGLALARNSGLDICNGDYISFVDSDDWILPEMYAQMIQKIKDAGAEMALCGCCEVSEDGKIAYTRLEEAERSPMELLKAYFERKNNIFPGAWAKLFKARLFNDVRFPECRSNEDVAIIHRLMGLSQKSISLRACYYMYFIRPGSLYRQSYDSDLTRMTEFYAKDILEFTNEHYPDLIGYARGYVCAKIHQSIRDIIVNHQYKYYRKELPQLSKCLAACYNKGRDVKGLNAEMIRNIKLMQKSITLYRLALKIVNLLRKKVR